MIYVKVFEIFPIEIRKKINKKKKIWDYITVIESLMEKSNFSNNAFYVFSIFYNYNMHAKILSDEFNGTKYRQSV